MGYFIPGGEKGRCKNIIHDTSPRYTVDSTEGEIVMGTDNLLKPV